MSLEDLMRDSIELIKTDGTTVPGLRASVQRNRIYMNANSLIIQPGDLIRRKLSTGAEETYRVVDPGFYEQSEGFPANYQMTVQRVEATSMNDDNISEERRKALFAQWEEIGVDFIKGDLMSGGFRLVGGPPATRRLAREWVKMKEDEREANYRVHVSGPNARVNIHSTDHSTNTVAAAEIFTMIRRAVDGVPDIDERVRLRDMINELESATDKSSFLSRYQALISAAANHMTILAPFPPPLAEMIKSFSG